MLTTGIQVEQHIHYLRSAIEGVLYQWGINKRGLFRFGAANFRRSVIDQKSAQ
jgi:hypothetical protein